MIKTILWASGMLAAVAVLVKGAVIIGLFLFIIPGLILAISPTVFAYTSLFAFIRRGLRSRTPARRPFVVNILAVALTLIAGLAVTVPTALQGRRAFAAAIKPDVTPSAPVPLVGDVRLDRFGDAWLGSKKDVCDALCAALLETPGVSSVTISGADYAGKPISTTTYRLVPKSRTASVTLMPQDAGAIVDRLPPDASAASGRRAAGEAIEAKKALKAAITARWSLRLSNAESLVSEPPLSTFDRIVTIRNDRAQGRHRLAVAEVEVADSRGTALLRHQRVTAAPIAAPLHFVPGGPMLDQGFEVGRAPIYTGPRYFDFKPIETLFAETTLARPVRDDGAVLRLRESLEAATAARAAGPVMVAPWLATLDWQHLRDEDIAVLAKLIADPRTTGLERLYDGYATRVSPRLRRAISARLLERSTDDRLRNTLNTLVRNMPDGTYAELLPEERALLADRELRLRSSALVARLADQGSSAVPTLLDLLIADVTVEPWAKRQWILADIRRGLSRLGRDAASALPTVERLFELKRSPLTNSWDDAQDWRVCMVRMGKPAETLTFPSHLSPESVARDREAVRRQAEKGPER